jgi:hypothetical protein
MPEVILPISNGYYKTDYLPASAQECLNLYPYLMQAPALQQEILVSAPGIDQVVSAGAGAGRGAHVMNDVTYIVQGDKLRKLNPDDTLTTIGTIEGAGRVWIADNGTQLCVLIPAGKGYIYNRLTNTLVEITDGDFRANGNPLAVAFVDSYFVFTTDEKKFICSAPNDGTNYNALDFGTAASSPDSTVAPIVYRNQLFIAGDQTAEAFQNIGGADFPFQRTGLFIQKGCYAPFSLINTQDSFMFVGGGINEAAAIWVVAGNAPQKVSTNAIDTALQSLTQDELRSVYAWTYAQNGSYFVGFALPTTTFVYDFTSQKWHERRSYVNDTLGAYRVSQIIRSDNRVICIDRYDGRVGVLSTDSYSEYGNNIVRRFVTQPFQNNMKAFFVPSIELTVESGMGNAADPDPLILMARSLDGKTWTNDRARPLGRVGEYKRRAIWRRNGRAARMEIFRFECAAKVKFVAMQLTANIEGGTK